MERRAPPRRRRRRFGPGAAKDYGVRVEELVGEWRQRAADLGLAIESIPRLLRRARAKRLGPATEHSIVTGLAGPDGLTKQRSAFTRRDLLQAICEALAPGTGATVEELEALADRFLQSERAVVLAAGVRPARGDVLQRVDGCRVELVPNERIFSTPELLHVERRILDRAQGDTAQVGVARPDAVEQAIASRPTISAEQATMVRRLTAEGSAIAVVVGQAGTGKTFALAAARETWEASGIPVVGTALARRAAGELEDSAGIRARASPLCSTSCAGTGSAAACRAAACWSSTRPGWCRPASWRS
jgi:hypothetical protein